MKSSKLLKFKIEVKYITRIVFIINSKNFSNAHRNFMNILKFVFIMKQLIAKKFLFVINAYTFKNTNLPL